MDFRRIDKNTVQCILSEEEMNAYGFRIEDFFSNQEKAREFLEHLVERAEEEIGYEAHSGMVSMQIMKMPDNGIVITLSERDNSADGFQNMLQHIHQQLASLIDPEAEGSPAEAEDELSAELAAEVENAQGQDLQEMFRPAEKRKSEKETKLLSAPRIFMFESLKDLEQLSAGIVMEKPISSAVYYEQEKDNYYLLLKKGRLTVKEYGLLCNRLREYAEICTTQPYAEQFCKEHFETFIPKHALRVLKNIETGN
ncbi:negative regulator of genetic competence sporulation and motility-like protein [Clostridium sp. CAG:277]|mgnify:FL=1|nr:negative regulator of genetic competence sporulation and motility-like protein [Clostridium sp. CAG:277]